MEVTTVQIISAFTALCAVILGPLVSIYVVNHQSSASVLSKNRQDWINTLREEVSDLISLLRALDLQMNFLQEFKNLTVVHELATQCKKKEAKIELLINPNESDHVELIRLIHEALGYACETSNSGGGIPNIEHTEDKIIKQTQTILKREWVRVKSLK